MELKNEIQDLVLTHIIKETSDKYATYQRESWFMPLISRDMINHLSSDKEFYHSTLGRLSALGLQCSYLYVFEKPIRHLPGDPWPIPQQMYLAAYHEGSKVVAFEEDERPVLTAENGIGSYHNGDQNTLSIFCLFSGEMQYGILVTEITLENFDLSYLISMQIGNALKYYDMRKQQEKTQRKLEKLVEEINEKNEILNFISEYDTLTGCLNRRGFLEKAVHLTKNNIGKQALLIFADLDHLKEINDCFGHAEGDFAIKHCASVMQEVLGSKGIVGRIGGDEFVALILTDEKNAEQKFFDEIRESNRKFNESSDRDYYIEISMGCEHFLCQENFLLSDLLDKADINMYVNKQYRRKTVQKTVSKAAHY
jgi:diguanylate cyclase (GGDEF)-like protein